MWVRFMSKQCRMCLQLHLTLFFVLQVSFVNKFATIEGGTHVDYVSNQIAAHVVELCKKDFAVKEHEVKRHLWVFINATMENQTFNSPIKEALTTPEGELGSDCELSHYLLQRGMVKNLEFFPVE